MRPMQKNEHGSVGLSDSTDSSFQSRWNILIVLTYALICCSTLRQDTCCINGVQRINIIKLYFWFHNLKLERLFWQQRNENRAEDEALTENCSAAIVLNQITVHVKLNECQHLCLILSKSSIGRPLISHCFWLGPGLFALQLAHIRRLYFKATQRQCYCQWITQPVLKIWLSSLSMEDS